MGELTARDDEIIRVPDFLISKRSELRRLLLKNSVVEILPNCPECFAREKKKIIEKYAGEESEMGPDQIKELVDKIEIPMKIDPATKHFICKRCGLYATREQVGDIRQRLNARESTREDKQYDYLEWWQKSKKEKVQ